MCPRTLCPVCQCKDCSGFDPAGAYGYFKDTIGENAYRMRRWSEQNAPRVSEALDRDAMDSGGSDVLARLAAIACVAAVVAVAAVAATRRVATRARRGGWNGRRRTGALRGKALDRGGHLTTPCSVLPGLRRRVGEAEVMMTASLLSTDAMEPPATASPRARAQGSGYNAAYEPFVNPSEEPLSPADVARRSEPLAGA